jgi:hypothetical protein
VQVIVKFTACKQGITCQQLLLLENSAVLLLLLLLLLLRSLFPVG